MKISIAMSLVVFGAVLFSSSALAEPPHIRTGDWKSDWDQKTCLKNVEKAVRSVGFRDNLDVDSNDVEANKGNYATETICSSNGWVFSIVAGPKFKRAGKLRDEILSTIRSMK